MGGAWKVAASLLPQVYVLVLSLVAARILGPTQMGEQSYISFVYMTVTLLITGGYAAAVMRYVAELAGRREAERAGSLVAWVRRRQYVAGALGAAGLAAVTVPVADRPAAWALAAVAVFFGVLHSVPNSVLVGLQQWRSVSIAALVVGGAATVTTVVVLLAGGGITGMFAVEAGAAAIGFLVFDALLRRRVRFPRHAGHDTELRSDVQRYAVGAWLHLVLHTVVWRRAELFLLERTGVVEEIAYYSIAFSLVYAVLQVPAALTETLTPAFATLHGADARERLVSGFVRAARLLTTLVLPLAVGVAVFAFAVVDVLYGGEYQRAGVIAALLALGMPFVPLHGVGAAVLQGMGNIRVVLVANSIATVGNLGLAVWLIPRHGAVGAAFANVGAQVTASVLVFAWARRLVGATSGLRHLGRPAVVAAVGAGAASPVLLVQQGAVGLVLAAAAWLVATFVALSRVGLLRPDDVAWLDEAAGDRLPGTVRRVLRLLAPPASRGSTASY